MATIGASATLERLGKPAKGREAIYDELWRRLGRFERLLPNLEVKTEFDGELWELAGRLNGKTIFPETEAR